MNPNLARVVLRPRGPLEVFDLAWRFLRQNWRPQLQMLALLWLPPTLLGAVLCHLTAGSGWLLLLPWVLAPFIQAPFTVLTGRLIFDPGVGIGAVLRETRQRIPQLFGIATVGALQWIFPALTCVFLLLIPAHAVQLYLPEVVLLEKTPLQNAVKRALALSTRHLGIALAGAVGRGAIVGWFALASEAAGQAIVQGIFQLGEPFGALMNGEVTPFLLGGLLLSQPIYAVYRLFLYVDVRTRLEGWDLQVGLRAAGLGR